jgi:hypothetical protein
MDLKEKLIKKNEEIQEDRTKCGTIGAWFEFLCVFVITYICMCETGDILLDLVLQENLDSIPSRLLRYIFHIFVCLLYVVPYYRKTIKREEEARKEVAKEEEFGSIL